MTPRAPSWSSAERTRAGSFSPVATITSTPAASSASVARRGAARETTTVSGISAAAVTSLESSGRRPSESKTTRRGWRCTPSMRAVSCGSSASAVPMPTATASHSARQWCDERAARLARDPLRVAGLGRDLAVERHRRLEEHVRAAGARVLAEGLVERAARGWRARRRRCRRRRPRRAGSRARGRRPSRSGRRRRRPRGRCRPRRSRRCTAACGRVAAGLERDVERRAGEVRVARGGDRLALGVRAAAGGVPALPQHLAVADDDRAHERVGADPAAPAGGELERALEVLAVGVGKE